MPITLELVNRTNAALPPRRFFILAAEKALNAVKRDKRKEKKGQIFEVSLIFVSGGEMRRLNKQGRGKDKATDVLSFPNFSPVKSANPHNPSMGVGARLGKILPIADPDDVIRLGEIVIAPSLVKKEAALFGHGVREHFLFLYVHGLLHLLGYDHEKSASAEKEMFKLQANILKSGVVENR